MSSTTTGLGFYPTNFFASVTPSDTALLSYTNASGEVEIKKCNGLYVGSGGNVAVADEAGNSVTFTGVVTGSILPVSTDKVLSTGTTASSITALF